MATSRTIEPDDEAVQTRPFADFLRETSRGSTHEELSETLQTLVQRVRDTGKKGALTYTVTIEPMKGGGPALVVTDEIKTKMPEHDRPASLFYADEAGNLVRDDPAQMSFEGIREVADPVTGVIREIGAKA